MGYAQAAGLPYAIGFVKNRYVGRTFLSPGQRVRERLVDVKLSVIASAVRGKRVVLLDDSVVRGTTAAGIVGKLRAAGAAEFTSVSPRPPSWRPAITAPTFPTNRQLIAAHHTLEEIRDILGCDSLGYLPRGLSGPAAGPRAPGGILRSLFWRGLRRRHTPGHRKRPL